MLLPSLRTLARRLPWSFGATIALVEQYACLRLESTELSLPPRPGKGAERNDNGHEAGENDGER